MLGSARPLACLRALPRERELPFRRVHRYAANKKPLGKFVSARRRNQHARGVRSPDSLHFDFDRQQMIDHVSAAIWVAMR
jgi:hypothetical protein